MKIDKISEEYKKQELNRQEFLTEIKKPTNSEKAYEFIDEFIQQINRSIMVENQILIEKLHAINKLLNDLYEEIDKNYTESLERNDKLSMNRAKSELELATKILDEVEKI